MAATHRSARAIDHQTKTKSQKLSLHLLRIHRTLNRARSFHEIKFANRTRPSLQPRGCHRLVHLLTTPSAFKAFRLGQQYRLFFIGRDLSHDRSDQSFVVTPHN